MKMIAFSTAPPSNLRGTDSFPHQDLAGEAEETMRTQPDLVRLPELTTSCVQ